MTDADASFASPQANGQAPPPIPGALTPPTLCPYCGTESSDPRRCDACSGLFEPLSRQASQNAMGPWFIRDEASPFRPGCSYATLRMLVQRGRVGKQSVLRGPSTRQFWMHARNVPGVAHLTGECHACHNPARPDAVLCTQCGASFVPEADRQYLGLAEVRLLPGQAPAAVVARSAAGGTAPAPVRSAPARPVEVEEVPLEPEAEPALESTAAASDAYTGRALSPAYDAGVPETFVAPVAGNRRADRQRTLILTLIIAASLAVLGVIILGIAAMTGQFSSPPAPGTAGTPATGAGAAAPAALAPAAAPRGR